MGISNRLLLLSPRENTRAVNDPVADWIKNLIRADESQGRSQNDFSTKFMSEIVVKLESFMKTKGFETYQGGGNVFFVTRKNGRAIVVQARPLAQRVVRLNFILKKP